MSVPLLLGFLFLIGLAADLLGRFTFLPRVTLLMLGGLAIGPSGFALLPSRFVAEWFPELTVIALSLIGFLLGHRLSAPALRIHGGRVIGISLCKVFGAATAVALALWAAGMDPVIVILLAGIAPATAPAAIYDIVHASQARGEFAETLLSVVALDDVWGMLLFILLVAFVGVMNGDSAVGQGLVSGLAEIGGSAALGVALGVPMAYLTGRIRPGEPTTAEALGFVLLGAGIAQWLGLMPILTAIVMGMMVASLAKHHERPFHAIEGIEWPFMILFFVLAGASLEIGTLALAGTVTAVYVIARFAGIYIGAQVGGRLVGAPAPIRNWLGVALLPQAGVAIGLALLAAQRYPETAPVVLTAVVSSTIVLETVGPVFARLAIRAVDRSSP